MSDSVKYYVFLGLLVFGLVLGIVGLFNIYTSMGPAGIKGVGFLCGGVLLGLVSSVLSKVYGYKKDNPKEVSQTEVETIAQLGKRDDVR